MAIIYATISPEVTMDNLFDVSELSERLGLAPTTIRKMICQRRIPYTKCGRRTVFRESDIEKWLEENTHKPIGQ